MSLQRAARKADISLALGSGQIMCSLQGIQQRSLSFIVPAIVCCLPMAATSFGIFDHVDRSDEPLGVLVQDLYLAGRKAEAEAAVPDALVDEVTLCGPRERIRERLAAWKTAGVTTLGIRDKIEAIRLMAELAL